MLLENAKENKVKIVTLESTLTSKSFYLKNGFNDSGNIETVIINGESIRCIPMSKKL